jgi:ribulose-5-phosphate 4-epimerase/fuculose-1-phosphate aldolase
MARKIRKSISKASFAGWCRFSSIETSIGHSLARVNCSIRERDGCDRGSLLCSHPTRQTIPVDTATKHGDADTPLRQQLATATRILHGQGILDYSGHISVRAPGRDALYIQPGIEPRSDITAEKILLVDFDGKVLEGAAGKPPVELAIHVGIFRVRPDVQAIIHSHLETAILFTMMDGVALRPMRARAVRWRSGIPTHADPSHIKLAEQGAALAATLGLHHAALMRAHGMVLTAESLPALVVDSVHFEENARALLQVLGAGQKPLPLTDAEMEQIDRHEMRDFHVAKLWKYYLHQSGER